MRKGDLKENDSKFRSVEVTRAFQYNAVLPDWRLDFGQIEWELGGERQSRLSGSLQPSIITKMNDPKQKWFSFSFDKQFVPCMEYWEMWPMLEQKDLWSGIVLGIRVWNLPFERSHADLAALFPTCLSICQKLFFDTSEIDLPDFHQAENRRNLNRQTEKNGKTVLSTIWLRINGISPEIVAAKS